jgi:O-antigen ligase
MTELAATTTLPRAPSLGRAAGLGASTLVLVLLGAGMGLAFNGINIPIALAVAGGFALVGFLLLTIRNYDTVIAIGLLLMGIVRFQPAPPDIVFAIVMCVAAVTGRFRLARVPALLRWIIALLLVLNLFSLTDVVSLSVALRFLFITAYLVLFALWLTAYVDRGSRARLVVVTWLVIGVASTVISVLALYVHVPFRTIILGSIDNGERAYGFFKDPNVFGPFLIPVALIMLEQRIAPKRPKLLHLRASTSWLALLVLSLGILFSYSRAAWVNFAIAVVVMLAALSIRKRGARRALRALVALLCIGGVTAVILSATGSIGFLEHRAHLQSYDTGRFNAQSLGWQLGWTHPVGIGPGQFESYSALATHSTFVRVFAEQGFMGLALLVALMLSTLVLALRNVVLGRDTHGIGSTALLGAWCGLIINSAVVDTLHWRHLWVVIALIWAAAVRGSRGSSDAAQSSVGRTLADRRPPPDGPQATRPARRRRASVPSR